MPQTPSPGNNSHKINKLILSLEAPYDGGELSDHKTNQFEDELRDLYSKYLHNKNSNIPLYKLNEALALLHQARGENDLAEKSLLRAVETMDNEDEFVSKTAKAWQLRQTEQTSIPAHDGLHKINIRKKLPFILIVALIIIASIFIPAITDWQALKHADPTIAALAQEAGMSKKGKLVLFRTMPQLVNDDQIAKDCQSKAFNSNGYLEQGCYNSNTDRIYIRKMPTDFHNEEVVTAAYEMLHPVYESIIKNGDTHLNQVIESEYASRSSDKDLVRLVEDFAKLEPGAQNEELFSILGTQYSDISAELANYYKLYFKDLSLVVSANSQVASLFKTDENKLNELKDSIDTNSASAETYYKTSLSWAYAGNAYQNDYNYNLYVQDLQTANSQIDEYNQLLAEYNTLITKFNGQQPITNIPTVPSQSPH